MVEDRFSSLMAAVLIHVKAEEWHEAYARVVEAETLARAEYGADDKRLGKALELKARICRNLGRSLEAEQAMNESVRIALLDLRRKAKSLDELQKFREAEDIFRQALEVCECSLGPDHAETATCLDNLATCLRVQSRFVEAFALFSHLGLESAARVPVGCLAG